MVLVKSVTESTKQPSKGGFCTHQPCELPGNTAGWWFTPSFPIPSPNQAPQGMHTRAPGVQTKKDHPMGLAEAKLELPQLQAGCSGSWGTLTFGRAEAGIPRWCRLRWRVHPACLPSHLFSLPHSPSVQERPLILKGNKADTCMQIKLLCLLSSG